ncbi:MAG: sigma-54 factor interaction domain-containing protein [Polyangiaceae bacterium]
MRDLVAKIAKIARRDVPVLVRGETGTGKELVATMLHAESRRATGPLVRFNCAALPAELAEAELFGHTKGAFTGAKDARPGFFRRADGGTIVLDEVGELPLAVQAKLLRALSGGEIQPLGAARTETVDVRVVASTHRDLSAEVRAGRFREDLYFRLAVIELVVPPLRERREDVALLARAFAARYAERFGVDAVLLDDSLVSALAAARGRATCASLRARSLGSSRSPTAASWVWTRWARSMRRRSRARLIFVRASTRSSAASSAKRWRRRTAIGPRRRGDSAFPVSRSSIDSSAWA